MFKITARTVLELGAELISSDIIAFYELIKNGFDAGSSTGVEIKFRIFIPHRLSASLQKASASDLPLEELKRRAVEAPLLTAPTELRDQFIAEINAAKTTTHIKHLVANAEEQHNSIIISDAGSGMTKEQLNKAFLVIGTTSRKLEVDRALKSGKEKSPFLGEKGIGRLSAMRLGNRLIVKTAAKESRRINLLDINWRDFEDVEAMMEDIPVTPQDGGEKPTKEWHGTSIVIQDLLESWSEDRVRELCRYDFARLMDPHRSARQRPRVVVKYNGERISIPFMPTPILQAAHAKITGQYRIEDGEPVLTCLTEVFDLGFEHPPESETTVLTRSELESLVISNLGDVDDDALVSLGPFKFEVYWYNRRRLSGVDSTGQAKSLRDMQNDWSGIMLFRDGFRVFPYGEDKDDWLDLDRRALRNRGYTLNKTQFIGRVEITRTGNKSLLDQTNREGLRVTPEQQVFLETLRWAVQDGLGGFMRTIEKRYKNQNTEMSVTETRVTDIENRTRQALKDLRKIVPKGHQESLDEIQQLLLELSEFAALAKRRIEDAEKEGRQLIDMAGIGLMVEVVAHELARSSENTLKTLAGLQTADVPDHVRSQLKTLQSQMKTLSKRIRILDPLSVSGRQTREIFDMAETIKEVLDAHKSQFHRHGVTVDPQLGDRPVRVRAVRGMVIQIIENLISNSIHWMDVRSARDAKYQPTIKLTLERGPPTLTYEDNGPGIAPENADKIFRPFFSLKEKRKRRGLGLFIAREIANHHDGALTLSNVRNSETNRLNRFVFELPGDVEQ